MKNILVPTDFSDNARFALETGAAIAKKANSRLVILHVVDFPTYSGGNSAFPFQDHQDTAEGIFILKLVQKRFKELMSDPMLDGVNVVEALDFGGTIETVTKHVDDHDIGLIVIGAHGSGQTNEKHFIGSNAEKIIRSAKCPVLTMKRNAEVKFQNLVFASDFGENAHAPFHKLKTFIDTFEPAVHLVKVNTPMSFERSADSERSIRDFADHLGIADYTMAIQNDETIESGVLAYAKNVDADVIAMETHGRKGLNHFFRGSLAEDVADHSELPMLTATMEDRS